MREILITDSLIEAPGASAVTLAYARQHIQALTTADDNMIAIWIAAATSYFERQTGRQLITATREAWLDAFPFVGHAGMWARIQLPNPPLQDVVFIEYLNADGDYVNFDDGTSPTVNLWRTTAPQGPYCRPGLVEPKPGLRWPLAAKESGAVHIRYRCGYGDADTDVPELARGVLCFLIAHFDQFRGAVADARNGQIIEVPYAVKVMLDEFKYSAMPTEKLQQYRGWGGGWLDGWVGGRY